MVRTCHNGQEETATKNTRVPGGWSADRVTEKWQVEFQKVNEENAWVGQRNICNRNSVSHLRKPYLIVMK